MPVMTFPFGPLEANCHILHNGKDAVIADPSTDTQAVLDAVKAHGLTIQALLLTHIHFDHAAGCAAMMAATGLPVYVGREDWEMRDTLLSRGMLFGMPPVPPFEASILEEGMHAFGSIQCQIIHAPGHSAGSLCYYVESEKALIAGDVLFFRSVGRSDFPGGSSRELTKTLKEKLYVLPKDTVVYCGHGENTLIGDEIAHNPFCRLIGM